MIDLVSRLSPVNSLGKRARACCSGCHVQETKRGLIRMNDLFGSAHAEAYCVEKYVEKYAD
jgi:hypothetical protein